VLEVDVGLVCGEPIEEKGSDNHKVDSRAGDWEIKTC
jgi:hypothetical protein